MSSEDRLKLIKDRLAMVYGARLRGVVQYGSEARSDAARTPTRFALHRFDGGTGDEKVR
ncbi:MAG: hypothetical protein HQ559_17845 [Lentisphaerae bacterium]|nr:hypothetical protein [Lentisphaerota bacterium]